MIKTKKTKIGIIGCGAIGSRIAKSIKTNLSEFCQLTGLLDIDLQCTQALAKKLTAKTTICKSLPELLKKSDLIVEATNAADTKSIIKKILLAKKSILVMSVGTLINAPELFQLARKNHCHILIPSGAIAGIDAIKAASLVNVKTITLTTRKPPAGLAGNPYLEKNNIDLTKIKKETVIFEGTVNQAVKAFPQNINVGATLALASRDPKKLKIRILTSPTYTSNSHEIEICGDFGRMVSRTENVACKDNPKTSYLAVLSGIQSLQQYCSGVFIGT